MRDLRAAATALLLFLLAFAVRCLPAPRVFDRATGAVHPFDPDSFYHLRRVLFTLENFPASLRFDPYLNFPHGGEPIWTPVFDWLLALVALPAYRGPDPASAARVEQMLVFVPPLLGAASVVVLYLLARRLYGETVGLVSALILALLSGHYWYSQIGFVDHHAAVVLLATALFLAAIRLLRAQDERAAWGAAAATGALLAALVLVWPGGLLHVAIVEAVLVGTFSTRADRETARRCATAAAVANAVAAACVAPLALTSEWSSWSELSPAVLSRFQPWLFALLALHASICAAAWRGAGATRGGRALQSAATLAVLLLVSVSLLPALQGGAVEAQRWLFKQEEFQATVAESVPLFGRLGGEDGLDAAVAEARLSRFVYFTPFAIVALLWVHRSGPDRHATRLVALALATLGAVTLLQRRFFDSFSVVLALAMGFCLVNAARLGAARLARWVPDARIAAVAAGLGTALAALWLMQPVLVSYRLPLRNVREALAGRPLTLPTAIVRQHAFERAALWLRDRTPPTSGFLDSGATPEYGVLALWTHGHLIEYVGRRPTVANNFGDDIGEEGFRASNRFFQAGEHEARGITDALRVRYLFLRTTTGQDLEALPRDSMQRLLSAEAPQVDWLRLVYDEPAARRAEEGRIRIFEVQTLLTK